MDPYRVNDPNNPQPISDFRAVAAMLRADPDRAVRRACEIAEERPDDVPDTSAIYLRVLGELAASRSASASVR